MAIEIEAKFLSIDIKDMRAKLQSAGAALEYPMRLMRRDQFDHADDRYAKGHYNERLRIRDEANKCTMTYKRLTAGSVYATEIETTIGSYETTKQLLTAVGLHSFSYQESKRETWLLDGVEVVIDIWPWLETYIEIEGSSEESIQAVANKLGCNWEDATYGSVDTAYMSQYPKMKTTDSIGDLPEVRFNEPLPDYLKERL